MAVPRTLSARRYINEAIPETELPGDGDDEAASPKKVRSEPSPDSPLPRGGGLLRVVVGLGLQGGRRWRTLLPELSQERLEVEVRLSSEPIYPVLLFSTKILSDTSAVESVTRAYLAEPFDGVFLWPNDFVEEAQPLAQLQGLARLLSLLADGGRRVSKLYGGYLSALLANRGLRGFSCGLGYGASKNAFAYGGGGGKPVQKFYIPRLHRSVRFEEAEQMLQVNESLRCSCVVCAEAHGGRIDHFANMREQGRCERHFLHARQAELQQLGDASVEDLAKVLQATSFEFERSGFVRAGFLRDWASVLAA